MFYTYIKGNPFLTRKLCIIGSFCLKAVIPLYCILIEINVIYSKVLNFAVKCTFAYLTIIIII